MFQPLSRRHLAFSANAAVAMLCCALPAHADAPRDGFPDPTFNGGNPVYSPSLTNQSSDLPTGIVIDKGGRIVLAGNEELANGLWLGVLLRLNADGSLNNDWPGFVANGRVPISNFLGSTTHESTVNSLRARADGFLLLSGYVRQSSNSGPAGFVLLIPPSSDGTTFSFRLFSPGTPYSDLIDLGDGRMAAVASTGEAGGLIINGFASQPPYSTLPSVSANFGAGMIQSVHLVVKPAIVRPPFTAIPGELYAVAAVGDAYINRDCAVMAVNIGFPGSPAFALEPNFGTNGTAVYPFEPFNPLSARASTLDTCRNAALSHNNPGDPLLMAGTSEYCTNQTSSIPNDSLSMLFRVSLDGTLDSGFWSGGAGWSYYQNFNSGNTNDANAIAVQSDGKILLAGGSDTRYALQRINADGFIDFSYGYSGNGSQLLSGTAPLRRNAEWTAMVLDTQQRPTLAGYDSNAKRWTIMRYGVDRIFANGFDG